LSEAKSGELTNPHFAAFNAGYVRLVVFFHTLCHNAASRRPAIKGCRGGDIAQS
jgi:hypothetical protein